MQIYIDHGMNTAKLSQVIDELETDLQRPGWEAPQRMGVILATKDDYEKELLRLKEVLLARLRAI